MYECDAWDFPGLLSRRRFRGKWLERQEFYNQTLSRHRLAWGGTLRGLEEVCTPEDLYRAVSEPRGATLWGEKSPHYSARLAQLARRYPNASFILIWRDPVEIYRSICTAGLKAPFFRRPGMLHRLIYGQEKMIRESAQLVRTGARVHHVSYDDLVDDPGKVCRGLCAFLGINFDEKMVAIERADLSAVYNEPQHDYLRRRVIERQKFPTSQLVPDGVAAKLARFRNRWERLSGQRLGTTGDKANGREPSALERLYHRCVGAAFFLGKSAKRAAFEFLPLAWFRTYRLFKAWYRSGDRRAEPGLWGQFLEHWPTVLGSFALLASVAVADYLTGTQVTLTAFYALPTMAMALIVSRGWGSLTALAAAIAWAVLQFGERDLGFSTVPAMAWNCFMLFAILETMVLLLDRIRCELAARAGDKS